MASDGGMLEGRSTIIFGASSGIGAAAARVFAEEGARLVIGARRIELLEELRDELVAEGHEVDVAKADVTSSDSVGAAIDLAVERYGRLDAAFNNAGITYLGACGVADSTEDEVLRMVDVNLVGAWRCLSAEVKAMRPTGGGSIVCTSSIGGYRAGPQLGPYAASKHGVHGLVKQAAVDHAKEGFRINVLAPGGTDTAMIDTWAEVVPIVREGVKRNPMGRIGQPVEMAQAACWLLSDRASYVNGAVLLSDGGATA